jgi:hypothetical protein
MTTIADLSSALGTTWFLGLTFVAGALVGVPAWNWVKKFFPWNKD